MMPLGGCSLVTDALRDEMGDEFADALDAQQAQNKAELEQLGKDLEELGDEVGAELKDMIQDKLNTPAHPLGADPINTYDNKGYITRLSDIPESEVKNTKQLNIAEFDPLSALTETLMSNIDDPTTSGLEGIGNGLAFLTDMWSNAVKVTQLRVTEGKDGRLNIDYGDPIELKYSGKEEPARRAGRPILQRFAKHYFHRQQKGGRNDSQLVQPGWRGQVLHVDDLRSRIYRRLWIPADL